MSDSIETKLEILNGVEAGPDHDLALKADRMGGRIAEWRKVGEMRLAKVEAKEGQDLCLKGEKIAAKVVLLMMDGKSDPVIFAEKNSDKVNSDTMKVMFNCINNPESFGEESDKFQRIWEVVKSPETEKALEVGETPKTQGVLEVREELKDIL